MAYTTAKCQKQTPVFKNAFNIYFLRYCFVCKGITAALFSRNKIF